MYYYYLIDPVEHPYLAETISWWRYIWLNADVKRLYATSKELEVKRREIPARKALKPAIEQMAARRARAVQQRKVQPSSRSGTNVQQHFAEEERKRRKDSHKTESWDPISYIPYSDPSPSENNHTSSVDDFSSHSSHHPHVDFGGGSGGGAGASGGWESNHHSSHHDTGSHSSYDSGHSSHDSGGWSSSDSSSSSSYDSGSGGFD